MYFPSSVPLAEIQAILDQDSGAGKSRLSALMGLLLSLVIFFAIGAASVSVVNVLILSAVILIHELGHSLGMRLLGYRGVRMFFIPMVGGVAFGTDDRPSGAKSAVVSLLGPLPGVLLGGGLYVWHFFAPNEQVLTVARMFLFINLLNLLPFHPLDGLRVLESCLFIRRPKLELVVKLLSGAALVVLALQLEATILAVLVGLSLLALRAGYRNAVLARGLFDTMPPGDGLRADKIPAEYLPFIVQGVAQNATGAARSAKALATAAKDVWRRVCFVRPSLGGTIAFVLLYVWSFLGGIVFGLLIEVGSRMRTDLETEGKRTTGIAVFAAVMFTGYVLPIMLTALIGLILYIRRKKVAPKPATMVVS